MQKVATKNPFTHLRASNHALARYSERVRPGLDAHKIKAELFNVMKVAGKWVNEPPEWAGITLYEGNRYLMISDEIFFIVNDGLLITCITKGRTLESDQMRNYKKARRAQKRHQKKQEVKARHRRTKFDDEFDW